MTVFNKHANPGSPCTSQSQCPIGYICSGGVCKGGLNTQCINDAECSQGLVCVNSVCVVDIPLPEPIELPDDESPIIGVIYDPMNKPVIKRVNKIDYFTADSSDFTTNDDSFNVDSMDNLTTDNEQHNINIEEYICHIDRLIDMCSYSKYNIYLLDNGDILVGDQNTKYENTQYKTIKNDIIASRIFNFRGYLYALSNKKIYKLNNKYFDDSNWKWSIWNLLQDFDIDFVSVTYNTKNLWVQSENMGMLIGKHKIKTKGFMENKIRIYGKDMNHYVTLDNSTATVYPSNEIINNVGMIALNYYNEPFYIDSNTAKNYKRISIMNWQPYLIK